MDLQRWDRAKELVGNTFELTALIQKRCRELVKDKQRKLVDLESRNPIQIALEEVLQGKIHLAPPPPAPVLEAGESDIARPVSSEAVPAAAAAPVQVPEEKVEAKID
jgi:DNA-directed RNA polymerase subunit K/omega